MAKKSSKPKDNLFKLGLIIFIICASVFVLLAALAFMVGVPKLNGPEPGQAETTDNTFETIERQLARQTKIKKFDSYDKLAEFLENTTPAQYGEFGFGRGVVMEAAEDSVSMEATPSSVQALDGLRDYSSTNIQVEGVDEADIIKTDGKYIYAVSKKNLFIIDAYPGDKAEILAKIEFTSTPQGIYLKDNKLVVYGRNQAIYDYPVYQKFRRRGDYTFLKVFNISNPKNPRQVRDLDFEGNYTNSRLIGNYVYFITTTYGGGIIGEMPVPRVLSNSKEIATYHPDVYYFDIPYQSHNLTTVAAVNIKNIQEDIASEVYLLSGNQNIYVSQNNIYITYTKYISEYQLYTETAREVVYPDLPVKYQQRIDNIEAVDQAILSKQEKLNKISAIIERYSAGLLDDEGESLEARIKSALRKKYKDIAPELEKTVIHKIAINKNNLEYKTFGEVTGTVLNQFSMDEHEGYFRIATTKNRQWLQYFGDDASQESYSNLYILDDNLQVVGKVENLAPGERIYSVRFMQGRAYLVSFKQVDPLFVVDVSVPSRPKVLGELKIPGFSNYLHPFDENYLIGFGKQTEEDELGRVVTKGLKLSLFNVKDVSNPKEVDSYVWGNRYSNSIALQDHHAWLFSYNKELLVVPVEHRNFKDKNFRGAYVFTVTKEGFDMRGTINHADKAFNNQRENWYGYNYYDTTVKRSLYIEGELYTLSNTYLKINSLDSLEEIASVRLEKKKDDDFEIIN